MMRAKLNIYELRVSDRRVVVKVDGEGERGEERTEDK